MYVTNILSPLSSQKAYISIPLSDRLRCMTHQVHNHIARGNLLTPLCFFSEKPATTGQAAEMTSFVLTG